MNPFAGKRVELRLFDPQDLDSVRAYLNQPDLAGRRYLPRKFPPDLPLTEKMAADLIEKWGELDRQIHLAVVTRENGAIVGHAGAFWGWDPLCPEVQVVIDPESQRRGLGRETLRLLVDWIFNSLPANSISAEAADWNQAGSDFLLRQGFQPAGRDRRRGIHRGEFYDLIGFDLLRSEWQQTLGHSHGA